MLGFRLTVVFWSIIASLPTVCAAISEVPSDIERAWNRLQPMPELQGWTLTQHENTLRLQSPFLVSVSGVLASAIEEGSAHQEDTLLPFWIEIRFRPIESMQEYASGLKRRQDIFHLMNLDQLGLLEQPLADEIWDHGLDLLKNNPLPTHISGSSAVSIVSILDDPDLSFLPDERLKDGLWIRYRVGFLFSELFR
jgi:hypothetical protein